MSSTRLQLITAPAVEPVSVDDAKDQIGIGHADLDDKIGRWITKARVLLEEWSGRAFITQTWTLWADRFPRGAEVWQLPKAPLQSVTEVRYTDESEVSQVWPSSDYVVSAVSEPGVIVPKKNLTWPNDVFDQRDVVSVTFIAGYGDDASDVPEPLREAILEMVAFAYENRGDSKADMLAIPGLQETLFSYWMGEY